MIFQIPNWTITIELKEMAQQAVKGIYLAGYSMLQQPPHSIWLFMRVDNFLL